MEMYWILRWFIGGYFCLLSILLKGRVLMIYSFASCFCFYWKSGTKLQAPAGKVQCAVGGRGGIHIFSKNGWGRNIQRLTLLLFVQMKAWSTCVTSSVCGDTWPSSCVQCCFPLSAQPAFGSWEKKKKKRLGGKSKWQVEAAQSPVKQVLLISHNSLLALPGDSSTHSSQSLWMCLQPIELHTCSCSCREALHLTVSLQECCKATSCPVVPVYL